MLTFRSCFSRKYSALQGLNALSRVFPGINNLLRSNLSSNSTSTAEFIKSTLCMPKTHFPQRLTDPTKTETDIVNFWDKHKVYENLALKTNGNGKLFILHDGPPYANGELHIGHALNKILKDIMVRYQILRGRKAIFIPGWDCHGLPIELKVTQNSSTTSLTPIQLRKLAREYAHNTIMKIQLPCFKRMGIWGFWNQYSTNDARSKLGYYTTMAPDYESNQLRIFASFFPSLSSSLVYREFKPVYWSPQARTALAESELEYSSDPNDSLSDSSVVHKSPSVLIGFQANQLSRQLSSITQPFPSLPLLFCIWTTSPWTLVANACITVAKNAWYHVVKVNMNNESTMLLVLAEETINDVMKWILLMSGDDKSSRFESIGRVIGSDLADGCHYSHPLSIFSSCSGVSSYLSKMPIVIENEKRNYVKTVPTPSASSSTTKSLITGLVHTAPAHGHDDFLSYVQFVNKTNKKKLSGDLPVFFSMIDDAGQFTSIVSQVFDKPFQSISFDALLGKEAMSMESNRFIIDAVNLNAFGLLFDLSKILNKSGEKRNVHVFSHKYPYDWRFHKPVMIRATQQFFVSLIPDALEDGSAACDVRRDINKTIDDGNVKFIPDVGKVRFQSMMSSRQTDWCISRQRKWGLPIPAVIISLDITQDGHVTSREITVMNKELINHVADLFESHSSDLWFSDDWKWQQDEKLVDIVTKDVIRQLQGISVDFSRFFKSNSNLSTDSMAVMTNAVLNEDTMDVWFDSGCSWSYIAQRLINYDSSLSSSSILPFDCYLEGSDQHRGWFQSSGLICSVAATSSSSNLPLLPYKSLITHGFVLDDKRRKMSKSLGNIVSPMLVMDGDGSKKAGLGADTLRLWVANVDYTDDVCISNSVMSSQFHDVYKKMRTTFKFLLSNLSDMQQTDDSSSSSNGMLDNYMINNVLMFNKQVESILLGVDGTEFNLPKSSRYILDFIQKDLSSFYFDVNKDRLYCGTLAMSESSNTKIQHSRRQRTACQRVLKLTMDSLLLSLSPILPFLTEEVFSCFHADMTRHKSNIFEYLIDNQLPIASAANKNDRIIEVIRDINNDVVNLAIDRARANKVFVGHHLQAGIHVAISCTSQSDSFKKLKEYLFVSCNKGEIMIGFERGVDDVKYLWGASQVSLYESKEELERFMEMEGIKNSVIERNLSGQAIVGEFGGSINVSVGISNQRQQKCHRCWFVDDSVQVRQNGLILEPTLLCERCFGLLDV